MTETITIELPETVRREIDRVARERGWTAEEFVAWAAAERAGAIQSAAAYFAERARRAKPGAFEKVFGLDREGGEPPREGDEIEG